MKRFYGSTSKLQRVPSEGKTRNKSKQTGLVIFIKLDDWLPVSLKKESRKVLK
jgi:hypothetical protein